MGSLKKTTMNREIKRPDVSERNILLKTKVFPVSLCIECVKNKPVKKFKSKREVNKKFCNVKCYSIWRSKNRKGENAPNFKDGRCGERLLIRSSLKMKEWRRDVFKRDKYACQECGDSTGGNLEAHHIKSFALFPKLRFEVSNGLTLCKNCHKLTENYGYKKNHKI